ncbi:MAG: hypothetical protein R2731_15400 [Nocardioides sp.]
MTGAATRATQARRVVRSVLATALVVAAVLSRAFWFPGWALPFAMRGPLWTAVLLAVPYLLMVAGLLVASGVRRRVAWAGAVLAVGWLLETSPLWLYRTPARSLQAAAFVGAQALLPVLVVLAWGLARRRGRLWAWGLALMPVMIAAAVGLALLPDLIAETDEPLITGSSAVLMAMTSMPTVLASVLGILICWAIEGAASSESSAVPA